MTFFAFLASGLLGLAAHWYNRYAQGRTNSTFIEYLKAFKGRTFASVISIFTAEAGLFQYSPPEITMQALLTAFMYGYTIDSVMNRDKDQTTDEQTDNSKEQQEDGIHDLEPKNWSRSQHAKKSLQEMIDESQEH